MIVRRMASVLIAAAGLIALSCAASAQHMLDRKVMSITQAKIIAAAAMAEAEKNNWAVAVAILDEGGQLMYLERRDGTQLAGVDIAIRKAKGALLFKRSSKVLEDTAAQRPAFQSLDRSVTMIEGGLPLTFNNVIVGSIGVSGATSAQDGQVAKAGADVMK